MEKVAAWDRRERPQGTEIASSADETGTRDRRLQKETSIPTQVLDNELDGIVELLEAFRGSTNHRPNRLVEQMADATRTRHVGSRRRDRSRRSRGRGPRAIGSPHAGGQEAPRAAGRLGDRHTPSHRVSTRPPCEESPPRRRRRVPSRRKIPRVCRADHGRAHGIARRDAEPEVIILAHVSDKTKRGTVQDRP